jgi:hypothetical protein
MVTIPKHVGVKKLKNTLTIKLCICWCYKIFNITKCTNERCKTYNIFLVLKCELHPEGANSSLGSANGWS